MTTDKAMVTDEFRRLLAAIPPTDRGYSWELKDALGSEAFRGYGPVATACKFMMDNTAALSAALAQAGQPVAYPKIMYVCERCYDDNPEMCGHDRTDIYVTKSGKWLCDGCIDDEGISAGDCVSPPVLYTHPSVSNLSGSAE
ncbi:hypothetical protein REJC140_00164 [Pseudorhizobium endolithicum]|uniref:Uncharacterized protein n=1 Tax=Pseudorhizobium endolithicum TaxID=1191678 RepID=A0ABM8PCV1_9HYPH|nr:hypothetical protein [Pseudorhizobium endolithicum]CAD7023313.1 hypothetical protein REJC140_00164 [Pseudorhizobium endolithicum]